MGLGSRCQDYVLSYECRLHHGVCMGPWKNAQWNDPSNLDNPVLYLNLDTVAS